jgi:hypothetical protein
MEKKLIVKIRRLSAMSPGEILVRCYRILREILDQVYLTFQQPYIEEAKFVERNRLGHSVHSAGMSLVDSLRQRKVFAWQEMTLMELRIFLSNHFSRNRRATLEAAEKIVNHEFDIIGLKVDMDHGIDWHYDILSKKSVPVNYWTKIDVWHPDTVREIRYIWELNRHQHFVTLAKASMTTGREKYAKALFSQWRDWLDKNPYKYGVNWTSALEVGLRLISWTWALQMAKHSRHFNDTFYIDLLSSIEKHAVYIEDHLSYFSSANNHLLGEALGLFYAGVYYPELTRASEWRKKGYKIFCREFIRQVYADGVCKEQAVHYHLYDFYFGFLFKLAARYQQITLPEKINRRLMKMAHFVYYLLDDKDAVPQIGDEDGGMALRLTELPTPLPLELLNVAAIQMRCGYLNNTSPVFTETAFWMCGFKGLKNHLDLFSPPPQSILEQFPKGGYYIIRHTEKPRSRLVFDCGPLGLGPLAGHGHADALSFILNIEDEPVLIDCGTYMYLGAGDERDYFRSSRAHNTVCVDGTNLSEILGPFQWGRKGRTRILQVADDVEKTVIHGRQTGYGFHPVTHERHLQFKKPDQWLVTDRLDGHGHHRLKLYFHTGALDFQMAGDDQVQFRFNNFSVLFASTLYKQKNQDSAHAVFALQVAPMVHSPHFGIRDEHHSLILSIDGRLPVEVTTRIQLVT